MTIRKTHPYRHCEVATEAMNCNGRLGDRSNLSAGKVLINNLWKEADLFI
jgi:hypothetical protein